jgi:Uma2 family endonuclease
MAHSSRLVTGDDLARMPEDGFRYELVRGRLVRMTPASPRHGRITMALAARLWHHVTTRGLGEVWTEVGFRLASDPDTVRAPDVSFVSTNRLPLPDARGFYRGAPDLAIEVLSPGETPADVHEKVRHYLGAGTLLIVVLDPEGRRATVHRPHADPLSLTSADTLELEPVVPGFRVRLEELFAPSPHI